MREGAITTYGVDDMMTTPENTNAAEATGGSSRADELKAALLPSASTLFEAQKIAGDHIRARTRVAFGRMGDAHLLVRGVLAGALLRTNGKRSQDGLFSQERRVLFASYVVGMPVCELAIEEGRYLQALALLRQEMETLAQVMKSHAGLRKAGELANVRILGKDIARVYGDLSAAAHASSHAMASELLTEVMETEEAVSTATYFYPVGNMKLARQAFALHLILTMNLIGQISIDYNKAHPIDGFGEVDKEALHLAMEHLRAEGLVEYDPNAAGVT